MPFELADARVMRVDTGSYGFSVPMRIYFIIFCWRNVLNISF